MAKISYMPTRLEMDEQVSDKAKIFYMRLCRLSNNDDEFCYATNEYLMNIMKCAETKLKEMFRELENGNYIKIFYTNRNNRTGRKIYAKLDIAFQEMDENDKKLVGAQTTTNDLVGAEATTAWSPERRPKPIIYNKFNINKNIEQKEHKNLSYDEQISAELNKIKTENTSQLKSEPKKYKNVVNIINVNLPASIEPKMWADFVQMRKEIKKPITQAAQKRMIERLCKFEAMGYNCNELLERSIRNNWTDVYEPKNQKSNVVAAWADVEEEHNEIVNALGGMAKARFYLMDHKDDANVGGRRIGLKAVKGISKFYYLERK